MLIREVCPRCKSPKDRNNEHLHHGQQHPHGHGCGHQFVRCCEPYRIANDHRGLSERILVARIALRGLWRAVGVTLKWLLGFLVPCFAAWPAHLHGQPVSGTRAGLIPRREGAADALASWVQQPAHKPGGWSAMDATTRQSIAFDVGARRHTSAEHLWAKRPQAYRQHATFYTDQ